MAPITATFTKWIGLLKKADDLKGKAEEIKGQRDALIALSKAKDDKERQKLVRDIIGIDGVFDDLITAVTKVRENLKTIDDSEPEWPDEAGCIGLFFTAAGISEDKGKGSKEAKKAWATYAKALSNFGDEVSAIVVALKGMQAQVPKRKTAAAALVKMAGMISSALDAALKVPLPSTIQAAVFAASEDAGLLLAQSQNVEALLDSIQKKVDASVKLGDKLEVKNLKWLAWAAKAADMDIQEIKKNAKADSPK